MSSASSGQPPIPPDSKRALLNAAEAVVQHQATQAKRPGRPSPRPKWAMPAMALSVSVIGAVLIVLQPSWLMTPPPAPEPREIHVASRRVTLASAAYRIQAFRAEYAHLPKSASEAGVDAADVEYQVTGPDSWQLASGRDDQRLVLRSTDSIPAFVGESFRVIARRGKTP